MSGESVDLDELGQMRAVMHPVRWQVLQELFGGSVLTATQAGERAGLSASAMSYHLHQLARLGLIERDESTDGRERPWQAVGNRMTMSAQPDAAVGAAMMRNLLADIARLLATPPPAEAEARPWPMSFSHASIRMSRADAKELHRRVEEIISEFDGDDQDPAQPEYDVYWVQGIGHSADRVAHPGSSHR